MLLRIFSAVSGSADPAGGVCAPSLELTATPGDSLSRAIWLSGLLPPLPLCGGLGRCGRCRVRFFSAAPLPLPAEAEAFSQLELAEGWRLACRRQVPDAGQLDIALPPENIAGHAEFFGMPDREQPTAAGEAADRGALVASLAVQIPAELAPTELAPLALAVDLGTTSVYWRAVRLPHTGEKSAPEIMQQGRYLNPQAGAGADIMSRLAVAQHAQGRAVLARLARQSLRRVMDGLEHSGVGRVERLCVAANTAMTEIFLDRPVEGLCAAPYRLGHQGHEWAEVPGFPPVYIPPLPAPFAGGDVSAGLAALLAADVPRPFVLADLGTNGELALVDKAGGLLLVSVPLGPALEGIGPQCAFFCGGTAGRASVKSSGRCAQCRGRCNACGGYAAGRGPSLAWGCGRICGSRKEPRRVLPLPGLPGCGQPGCGWRKHTGRSASAGFAFCAGYQRHGLCVFAGGIAAQRPAA